MKNLTNYINEKANFIVKKHVQSNNDFVTSKETMKNGQLYKMKRGSQAILGQLAVKGDCIFTYEETGKELFCNEFVIRLDIENNGQRQVWFKDNYGNAGNPHFEEPTEDEIALLREIQEYIEKQHSLKDKQRIGTIINDKFIPMKQ